MTANLLFIHALTSLHPGTGQGVGVIDLPVAREVATGIPYLPGSSLKGVLRDRCADDNIRTQVFGPDTASITDANARAGAAIFADQRLLLLPVRSLAGTFAWVTSPFILRRFERDCRLAGIQPPDALTEPEPQQARVPKTTVLRPTGTSRTIYLEDLDLESKWGKDARRWAEWLQQALFPGDANWQTLFQQRFCIVHDDVLSFLLSTATEITARNVLDSNKTSKNLWYVESLPAETVLYGPIMAQQVGDGPLPAAVLAEVGRLMTEPLQLGGNASVGRGLCRLVPVSPETAATFTATTEGDGHEE
jgi:CRISPR-associated protein Cmr4